jgi:exosortase N
MKIMERIQEASVLKSLFASGAVDKINRNYLFTIYILLVLAGGAFAFPLSFLVRSNVLIGLILFPFTLFCTGKQRFNYAYCFAILFFGAIAYVYHVRMFYFFTLAFFMLFLIELFVGKTNWLVLFLLVFMSPFFHQAVVILGFPIRLMLTFVSGKMLTWSGLNVQVEGNALLLNGSSFTVDEACVGLIMLATSMLMGVFILAHQYRNQKLRLDFFACLFFFSGIFVMNVLANLMRIMILVTFQIGPEKPMHEVIGLLCFILYILLPTYFLSRVMIRKFGRAIVSEDKHIAINILGKASLLMLSICIFSLGIIISSERHNAFTPYASISLPKFKTQFMDDGITKTYNSNTLIYVKPIAEFFSAEHTPLLCWKGSGYDFNHISKRTIDHHDVYFGQLIKDDKILYTSWWYSNGKVQTIDQIDWRLRMLKGEQNFCLINVTAASEASLYANLKVILKNKDLLSFK